MAEAVRRLKIALLTEGDPRQLTGGYLYQQRTAAAASAHGAQLDFVTIPRRLFAQQVAQAGNVLRHLHPVDALLLDSIVAAAAAPWLPALLQQMPVIALVHQQPGGTGRGHALSALRKRLDLYAYRRSTAVIAVSDWLAERLRAGRVPSSQISVVRPGRESPALHSEDRLDLRLGRKAAVLCVSNWHRNKGIHLLLDAVAHLDPNLLTLHLVGDPSIEPAYERQLRARLVRNALRDRVVVHGVLAPTDVARLMQSADLLVHASRHESYGSSVAEAMAAGLPVVAFAVDNLSFLVLDGRDGLLVPYGDIPWFRAAIRLLVEDPSRRQSMAESAHARALRWPTWTETADRFYALIRQTVSERQTANFR